MKRIVCCPLCHSEMWAGRACGGSGGLYDEDLAVKAARDEFVRGTIEVDELEQRLNVALTDPPRAHRSRLVFR